MLYFTEERHYDSAIFYVGAYQHNLFYKDIALLCRGGTFAISLQNIVTS